MFSYKLVSTIHVSDSLLSSLDKFELADDVEVYVENFGFVSSSIMSVAGLIRRVQDSDLFDSKAISSYAVNNDSYYVGFESPDSDYVISLVGHSDSRLSFSIFHS